MAFGNVVEVVGNVTRDPELKFTASGQALAQFGLAVNRKWKDSKGEQQEVVSFFDVTAWGQLGENVAESIEKGTRVVVSGRLDQQTWETDKGEKRSKVGITADEVSPSLRWATVVVHRNERTENGGGQQGGRSQGGGRRNEPEYSEEPF